jgi:peptide/nickel transport system permease protein
MVIVSLIVFAMVRLTGDPAAIIAGDLATSQQLAAIHHSMGLDQPLYVQFYIWLRQLVHGNLGVSLSSQIPVTALIVQRLGPTLALSIGTIVLSVCAGVPLGILAAARPGSWLDRGVVAFSAFGFSVPGFITGYIVIQIFALSLRALPVQGYEPLRDGIWPFIEHLILPVLALSASYVALIIRITRTSILEVVNEDFIRTARAKGQSERGVFLGHALRNAAVPIVTVIGTGLAVLIGGVVVTESVFNIPGLGRLVVDAVLSRDFPVIQGLILLFSLTYVVVNLFVDLTYTVIDPRIRY